MSRSILPFFSNKMPKVSKAQGCSGEKKKLHFLVCLTMNSCLSPGQQDVKGSSECFKGQKCTLSSRPMTGMLTEGLELEQSSWAMRQKACVEEDGTIRERRSGHHHTIPSLPLLI